ncbi:MAG: ATP-binding protein [Candidatus Competibacteraceae bacterium]|nr:ATP-binding protein [Candidatus Competibacteraceae bacterium]MCP5133840.1 ATP-binding protein [Gammaproteobacteria bacterium]
MDPSSQLPWKPWHHVVTLREDLRTGELALNQFAADLYEVLMQSGKRPLYEDPHPFFALTYPTHNLRELAKDVALRLAGQNDKAVQQLELTYGGGKTHTLITLRHLFHDPVHLPTLPAVDEFVQHIGQTPPHARVVALCFDKLDLERGLEVRAPNGQTRRLKQPWSLLAYQLAGDAGLAQMRDDGQAEERTSAPAESVISPLLESVTQQGLSILVLIDEVMMYARGRYSQDPKGWDALIDFFQGLTQAIVKTPRCAVIASLLASDPDKNDTLGRRLQGQLYDIYRRQSESAVEPVVKEDAAEVLRRRFFTPESIRDRNAFKPHVIAALKGIQVFDDSAKGKKVENDFVQSYPFHPDLTEVFYTKWVGLDRFQKTRGVLRTFALALRDAEHWDDSPLVGPSVFLNTPAQTDLAAATRELCIYAENEDDSGHKHEWKGLLIGELECARRWQDQTIGLKHRELEQAVVATFLHSQPIGRTAKLKELTRLIGPTRPDKINLEKGLRGWAEDSHWLDDQHTDTATDATLPKEWRLGNRPNLKHMHDQAEKDIVTDVVKDRLEKEIGKLKTWFQVPPGLGVRLHLQPKQPSDIEDDGAFHFAILGPNTASEASDPSPDAVRFLTEKTGPNTPRAYPNAIVLVVPSRDGLRAVEARIKDYLAWEKVDADLGKLEATVDPARKNQLQTKLQAAKQAVPGLLRQAYCIGVTLAAHQQPVAFRLTVSGDPLFDAVKAHAEARIMDATLDVDALLPSGPYHLWHPGDTRQRVKVLVNAFAERPALPKMLRTQYLYDTLADGCVNGAFVLLLTRPDRSVRAWWRTRPDDAVMTDKDLELVLPEAATLVELDSVLLTPGRLPGLWTSDVLTVRQLYDYFQGGHSIQVDKGGGYEEPLFIPKTERATVDAAIQSAVVAGTLWLVNPPSSLWAEPIPTGVLTEAATLRLPPPAINVLELLPAALPDAWVNGQATVAAIAQALSAKNSLPLPWKTVCDAINGALQANYLEATGTWPCEIAAAAQVTLREKMAAPLKITPTVDYGQKPAYHTQIAIAEIELATHEVQDLADVIPELTTLQATHAFPMRLFVRIECGDGTKELSEDLRTQVNAMLEKVQKSWQLKK